MSGTLARLDALVPHAKHHDALLQVGLQLLHRGLLALAGDRICYLRACAQPRPCGLPSAQGRRGSRSARGWHTCSESRLPCGAGACRSWGSSRGRWAACWGCAQPQCLPVTGAGSVGLIACADSRRGLRTTCGCLPGAAVPCPAPQRCEWQMGSFPSTPSRLQPQHAAQSEPGLFTRQACPELAEAGLAGCTPGPAIERDQRA